MDSCAVTAISICSGVGGLELGVRLVLPGLRVIAYGERDIAAATVLAARMADGQIDAAPIWSDVTTFDGARWAGSVDIVMGGVPCQPFSVAGKRRGQDDERWIWPDIWRWVREVRPRFVYLENVPGFVRHGLPVVLKDLAEAGFAAEWDCFSAAQLGAPHKRERVFVLAYRDGERELQPQGIDGNEWRRVGHCRSAVAYAGCASDGAIQHVTGTGWQTANAGVGREDVAHANGERQQERQPAIAAGAQHAATERGGGDVADADGGRGWTAMRTDPAQGALSPAIGQEGDGVSRTASRDVGDAAQFVERKPGDSALWHEYGGETCGGAGFAGRLFPPGPGDRAGWREWLAAGGPAPAESPVRGDVDGVAGRMGELFTLGNGVVPIVAGYAFATLARRLGVDVHCFG